MPKEVLRELAQPDGYWNWDYKLRLGNREARYESYAIEVDDLTQGLMLLETEWHRSQFPQRPPLVYVEALASAPWNRRQLENPPYLVELCCYLRGSVVWSWDTGGGSDGIADLKYER